jgi:hypothetical protein
LRPRRCLLPWRRYRQSTGIRFAVAGVLLARDAAFVTADIAERDASA